MPYTVTGHATVDGSALTATATLTVTPPQTSVVLGASLGQSLPAPQTLAAVRLYSPSKVATLPAGVQVVILSDKSTSPSATVSAVKSRPDVTFYCTFNHEPDDDIKNGGLTPASWAAGMNAYGAALAPVANACFGPIHNGSYGKTAWDTDSANCNKALWNFWGMDRYSPNYEAPVSQFKEGADYARALGLPVVIGECGADPANASAQQTLAAQIRAWSLDPANGAAVVCWWQQTGYTFANANAQHAFLGA